MKFLPGAPAAVVGGALVIAEMHLGLEFSLHEKGARIFPDARKSAKEVNALLKNSGCNKIIFLGDLKQDVKRFEQREKKLLEEFLSLVRAKQKILVKGNHDSGVEEVEGLQVTPPEGIVVEDEESEKTVGRKNIGILSETGGKNNNLVGLAHGHAWPSKQVLACATVCLGHAHPLVQFVDANGNRRVEKVWLAGETKLVGERARKIAGEHGVRPGTRVIVFPAFSNWAGGVPVNARFPAYPLLPTGERDGGKRRGGLLGPLFANGLFDLKNAVAYTLDGSELGRVSALRSASSSVTRGSHL